MNISSVLVYTTFIPVFFSNSLPTLFVISKTMSFSFVPYLPLVPGSLPPWPASSTIVSSFQRSLAFFRWFTLSSNAVLSVITISLGSWFWYHSWLITFDLSFNAIWAVSFIWSDSILCIIPLVIVLFKTEVSTIPPTIVI